VESLRTISPQSAFLPARLPTLDGLRAIAILLVVPQHLNLLATPSDAGTHVLIAALDRGWLGVQLFFVLSGFLITGILLDSRDARNYFGSFYMRRVLRIFPLYFATLIFIFVLLPALGLLPGFIKRDPTVELSYWLFFSNWYGPFHQGQGSMPHLWSLAVEEQFYLLWPFLLHRRSTQSVMRLCLTIAVASLVLRTAMLLAGSPTEAVYTFLVSRMDALALGGFAAAAFRTPSIAAWALHHRRSMLCGGIVLLLAGAVISRGYYFSNTMTLTLGYTLLAVAFALLVATGVAADRLGTSAWAAVLRSTVLRKVGQYSYAMYILHVPLHALVGQPILRALGLLSKDSAIVDIFYIVIGTVVTYLAAAASFHFLEVHFLRLKDRFSPATVIPPASR